MVSTATVAGDWWPEAQRLTEIEGLSQYEAARRLGVTSPAVAYAKRKGWTRVDRRMKTEEAINAVVALVRKHPGARTRQLYAFQAGLRRTADLRYTRFYLILCEAARRGILVRKTVEEGMGRYSTWRPARL